MTNNRPQFDSRVFKNFCNELKVKNLYSTPWYPQNNGQAESSNKTLLTALISAKGKWVEELPRVLWTYKTTSRKPTEMSPFALTYKMEATILTKIWMPILQTEIPEEAKAKTITKDLRYNIRAPRSCSCAHSIIPAKIDKPVQQVGKTTTFQDRDSVLRRVFKNTANLADGM